MQFNSRMSLQKSVGNNIEADVNALGRDYIKLDGKTDEILDGYYRVCVAYNTADESGIFKKHDFHFFRQNSDESWSSKPGAAKVQEEGNDPEKARQIFTYSHYEYFAVSIQK